MVHVSPGCVPEGDANRELKHWSTSNATMHSGWVVMTRGDGIVMVGGEFPATIFHD